MDPRHATLSFMYLFFCLKAFSVITKNAVSPACARRWCRRWTTCCVPRPWSRGRTWTAQSRRTLPPCYWTCWKRELSCSPTTCTAIGFLTERPALVRKQHWWCVDYKEFINELQFVEINLQVVNLNFSPVCFILFCMLCFQPPDLEVHVLNTEMDLQDLSFPQNYGSDSSIQLSASTIKQYSRNGQQTPPHTSPPHRRGNRTFLCGALLCFHFMPPLNNLHAVD